MEKNFIEKQQEKADQKKKESVSRLPSKDINATGRQSPKSKMMTCLKSHLDFKGECVYATQTKFEATANKKKRTASTSEIDFGSTYISPTMSYQRFAVQGFLKKYVNKVKFFQKKMKYKRYFVLDHNARKMRIH